MPTNTDPLNQPLYQGDSNHFNIHDLNFITIFKGIIAALKADYRHRLLKKNVENIELYDDLEVLAQKVPMGTKGLTFGCPLEGNQFCFFKANDSIDPRPPLFHNYCSFLGDTTSTVSISEKKSRPKSSKSGEGRVDFGHLPRGE